MTAHIVTLVVLVVSYRYPDALLHTAVVLDCIIVYACTTKCMYTSTEEYIHRMNNYALPIYRCIYLKPHVW